MKSKAKLHTIKEKTERITTQMGVGRPKSSGYESGSPELVDPPVQYLQEVTLSSRKRITSKEELGGPQKFVLEFNTPSLFERYNKVILKSFGHQQPLDMGRLVAKQAGTKNQLVNQMNAQYSDGQVIRKKSEGKLHVRPQTREK